MPITPVTMPQLGESVTEGTIGKWLKQPGDTVEKYESLAEVITDKVNAEIPSPVSGVIKELKVEEGATVPVGTEILSIDEGGDAAAAPAPQPSAAQAAVAPAPTAVAEATAPAAPAPAAPATVSGENGRSQPQHQPQPSLPGDMTASVAGAMPQGTAEMYTGTNVAPAAGGVESEDELLKRRSTPAVRRLAEEHGVSLSAVQGTGLSGRVTKEDILQYVAQRGAAPAPAQPSVASAPSAVAPRPAPAAAPSSMMGDTPMGLTPMRRAIARHMVDSVHTSPHAWTTIEIDMTNMVKYRDSIKAEFEKREGIPVTYYSFFIKAVVEAVKQIPQTNAVWSDEQGIVLRREVNVGVPIELGDQGLIVPVIHGADNLSVTGIARKLYELAEKARAGKLSLADIEGGTITVNNTGSLGVVMTHSIINQPQSCLVTMEAIVKRPVVVDDAIAIRSMMYSTIALDHRILDGAVGARFLRVIKQSIEGFSAANSGL